MVITGGSMDEVSRGERICVIGAGPAGITTAYELAEQGFACVTVLERATRVGGLCLSVGFRGRAFDLGANYVTSAYREVRRLANRLDAPLYTETSGRFFQRGTRTWSSIFTQAQGDAGLFAFGSACGRYLWRRWRLDRRLPTVGYDRISEHPDLLKSFEEWLRDNDLLAIRTLCSIPVTLMGYGRLEDIPAPYALTYLNPRTFLDLLLYGSGLPRRWPKRFDDGFQRLFERMAWHLDVRLNTTVTSVHRDEAGVQVTYNLPLDEGWLGHEMVGPEAVGAEQARNAADERGRTVTETFDRLVLACPLQDVLLFLDASAEEVALMERIVLNPFATTTYVTHEATLPARVVNIVEQIDADPDPRAPAVSIVTQQFAGNPLVTFYTPLPAVEAQYYLESAASEVEVLDGVRLVAGDLGLELESAGLFSCDRWPYFPHVAVVDIADGWYDRMEALQGTNRTFYVGGVMCFELIEPIVEYSRHLVRTRFAGTAR